MRKILTLILLIFSLSVFAQTDTILLKCNISNNIINENGISTVIPVNIMKDSLGFYTIEVISEDVLMAEMNSTILFFDGTRLYKNNRCKVNETVKYIFSLIEKSDLNYLANSGEKSYRLYVFDKDKNEMKYSFLNLN